MDANVDDDIYAALSEMGLDMSGVLNNAFAAFPQTFGRHLRQQRESAQATLNDPEAMRAELEAAGMTLPPELFEAPPEAMGTEVMSLDAVSQLLRTVGFSLSPDELADVEAGTYPNIDVRLMLALTYLLEFSVDAVLIACLQNAMGDGEAEMTTGGA